MRFLPLRASEHRRKNSSVAKNTWPAKFGPYGATVKAGFTAREIRIKAHQPPANHEAARGASDDGCSEYDVKRRDSLIPGIITVVFRDRNTNAAPKFSFTATEKFIRATQQVRGTSVRSLNL
jgi:hypothetical protein